MRSVTFIAGACMCLTLLAGSLAVAGGREQTGTQPNAGAETDFDRQKLYQDERHDSHLKRPACWVGPWPPRSAEEETMESDLDAVPGGGDVPPAQEAVPLLASDNAVPPPKVASITEGAEHALALPDPPPTTKSTIRLNTRGSDLTRASYEAGSFGVSDPHGVRGRFTWSSGVEKAPVPLFTRAGFVTLVEFKNGERPSGGAFCGSCARVMPDGQVSEEGAFIVEAMADKVSIRPRETSSAESGLLATNLHIVTDSGRTLTFDVIEVTGTALPPTERHEVRGSRDEGSAILDYSFPSRVAETSKAIEDRLQKDLSQREKGIVAEKASQRMDTYTDTKVERKASGRKLQIEAASTLGDETVIRMRVDAAPGQLADPVAFLRSGSRVRILKTRSILRQPESSSLVITLSVEGVVLGKDQRIAVSMLDKQSGEMLRSSVGRG